MEGVAGLPTQADIEHLLRRTEFVARMSHHAAGNLENLAGGFDKRNERARSVDTSVRTPPADPGKRS